MGRNLGEWGAVGLWVGAEGRDVARRSAHSEVADAAPRRRRCSGAAARRRGRPAHAGGSRLLWLQPAAAIIGKKRREAGLTLESHLGGGHAVTHARSRPTSMDSTSRRRGRIGPGSRAEHHHAQQYYHKRCEAQLATRPQLQLYKQDLLINGCAVNFILIQKRTCRIYRIL